MFLQKFSENKKTTKNWKATDKFQTSKITLFKNLTNQTTNWQVSANKNIPKSRFQKT